MRTIHYLWLSLALVLLGCSSDKEIMKESWINEPLNEWPNFALTNQIGFTDTLYSDIANGFLINTGKDTLAATCKHIFMVFQNPQCTTIDLGTSFTYWDFYPKNNPLNRVRSSHLINTNKQEPIGEFRTIKDRDWIIFNLDEKNKEIYPLKIRFKPLEKNEIIYAVGWGMTQKDNKYPAVVKMQCYRNEGNYCYVKTISTDIEPYGRSGSAVIDKNGYLVGVISGAEGKLAIIGSIAYLKKLFDQYGVEYTTEEDESW